MEPCLEEGGLELALPGGAHQRAPPLPKAPPERLHVGTERQGMNLPAEQGSWRYVCTRGVQLPFGVVWRAGHIATADRRVLPAAARLADTGSLALHVKGIGWLRSDAPLEYLHPGPLAYVTTRATPLLAAQAGGHRRAELAAVGADPREKVVRFT